jgi:toxin ParE1/3/4
VTSIRYTVEAAQDLEDIYRYIADDNISAAMEHRQRLKRRCTELLDQPRVGRKRDEIKDGLRSVTEGDYVILYRIAKDDAVAIMRVVHGSRDLTRVVIPE